MVERVKMILGIIKLLNGIFFSCFYRLLDWPTKTCVLKGGVKGVTAANTNCTIFRADAPFAEMKEEVYWDT